MNMNFWQVDGAANSTNGGVKQVHKSVDIFTILKSEIPKPMDNEILVKVKLAFVSPVERNIETQITTVFSSTAKNM